MRQREILVVDDSLSIRKMVEYILHSKGYLTATAKDGQEALEKLVRYPYQLVILDINMPRLDGFGLLKWLRADKRLAGIPVIMLTTENKVSDKAKALELGANCYLNKPFKPSELLKSIHKELEA
ncbi:MAG TPA: response regulator [Actinobacteria bacterium]|nr:response regulator [Actinomycetes bacterium]HEX21356.1 response regulator [Actinomycetota bacterium]